MVEGVISYKGRAKFYYNLMFYFYAMPFVLADDGIMYNGVVALEVEGKQYPGIHISYGARVAELIYNYNLELRMKLRNYHFF